MKYEGYELTVDGTPLCETYGLVLDSYSDKPPALKTAKVAIPGRDGTLDLSEWLTGAPVYNDRTIECILYPVETFNWLDIEDCLTRFRNFLHGRRFSFVPSWDADYTYTGRFSVATQKLYDQTVEIKLQIVCEPYKSKGIIEYLLNGELGKTYTLNGPAKETVPIVTCTSPTIINLNGQSFAFDPGKWTNEDMVLHHGKNIVHVNTTLDYGKAVWADYGSDTWEKYAGFRLGYLVRAGTNRLKSLKWSEFKIRTWDQLHGTWRENIYVGDTEAHEGNDIKLTFEWKDI